MAWEDHEKMGTDPIIPPIIPAIIPGAGIDVFEVEPTHNKELLECDTAILTPHVGGVSKEALYRMEEHVVNDIVAFMDNKEPKYRLV